MTSGTFQVGETVEGVMLRTGLSEENGETSMAITFRVAQSNHKEGPYDAATKSFREIIRPLAQSTLQPQTF